MSSRQQGLTLLELLVALVIISLLASVGIPNFSQWNCSRNQRYEFDQFAGLLSALRSEALATGRSFRVTSYSECTVIVGGVAYPCGGYVTPGGSGSFSSDQDGKSYQVQFSDVPVLCDSDQNWSPIDDSVDIELPELDKLSFNISSTTCFFPNDFDGYASSSSIEFSKDACGANAADVYSSYKLQVLSATGLLRRFKRQSASADWLSL